MVLELVPDMPEIIEEAAAWQPVTYIQHFAASVLSDRELAIWAYENAPKEYIDAFEELGAALDTLILRAVTEISQLVDTASGDELRDRMAGPMRAIRELQERTGGVTNGPGVPVDQKQHPLLSLTRKPSPPAPR